MASHAHRVWCAVHRGGELGPRPPGNRSFFLDAIRAGAIVEVLLNHLLLFQKEDVPRWVNDLFRAPIGVQIFLALSGWLLGGQLFRELGRTGRIDVARFWGRRWLRTLPAYYAVLALRTASGDVSTMQAAGMLVFAQNYLWPGAWRISWSLCLQEQFYLVLPLVLLVVTRRPRLGIAIGVASLLIPPVLRWHAFRVPLSEASYFESAYAPSHMRLDGLAVGVLLAALSERAGHVWAWIKQQGRVIAVAGVGILAVIAGSPWFFDRMQGMPISGFASAMGTFGLSLGAAMLIPAAVGARSPEGRWWQAPVMWIADHSYALYLLHTSVYVVAKAMGERLALPPPVLALLMVAAALFSAFVLRAAVEKPALRLRDRLAPRPGAARTMIRRPYEAAGRSPASAANRRRDPRACLLRTRSSSAWSTMRRGAWSALERRNIAAPGRASKKGET